MQLFSIYRYGRPDSQLHPRAECICSFVTFPSSRFSQWWLIADGHSVALWLDESICKDIWKRHCIISLTYKVSVYILDSSDRWIWKHILCVAELNGIISIFHPHTVANNKVALMFLIFYYPTRPLLHLSIRICIGNYFLSCLVDLPHSADDC